MAKHELHVGESIELEVDLDHMHAAPMAADWDTSNSSVVSVEDTANPGRVKVTAMAKGTATVRVSAGEGFAAEQEFVVKSDPKAKIGIKIRK